MFDLAFPRVDYYYNEDEMGLYKQNHQYSYVMKRAANTPNAKPKNTHKNKSKLHSKSKDKKFNPLEYLNSLIDEIHDHRYDTARKRPPSCHRLERSSALAYTTPISERTASSSKVRSKSSYSQYRKRSMPLRDILRVDLEQAITEEDNYIHFTEETVHSPAELPLPAPHPHSRLTPAAAARRIQRAWRKFQTLKVVRKYYMHYKNVVRREKQPEPTPEKQVKETREGEGRKVERRREFQRTLKIKKSKDESHNRTIRLAIGEGQRIELSSDASSNTTKQLVRETGEHELHEAKTVELHEGRRAEVAVGEGQLGDGEVFSSEEYTSKDLKFVIDLFRSREETAAKEINHQLDAFCQLQAQLTPLECFTSNESEPTPDCTADHVAEALSPVVFSEMERVTREKYEFLRDKLRQQWEVGGQGETELRQREQQIEGRMRRELRNIDRCREDYMRSIRQLKENMLKLQADSSKIERLAQQSGRTPVRVRKSYSADTLVLKSILEEVTFKNFDVESRTRPLPIVLEGRREDGRHQEGRREQGLQLVCPTSPPSGIIAGAPSSKGSLGCYEFSDSDRLQEEIYNDSNCSSPSSSQRQAVAEFEEELSHCESSSSIQISVKESCQSQAREDPATALLRECAEEMQGKIEKVLIEQAVEEVFLNAKMYALFKPYVERPFEFRQITDFDIFAFLNHELPRYFQPPQLLLARFNQKINPNSLQILRLIRDFDFEIDEYELVLPEDVFKAYRRSVEDDYAAKIRREQEGAEVEGVQGVGARVRAAVGERRAERREKRAKFLRFERDLKIMYMKAVFNCYNELIIETKSFYTFMNGRSSIGPGQLSLALREYNLECGADECVAVVGEARGRVERLVREKSMLPVFRSYKELEHFQKQVTRQISSEMAENEFKWVNYMDEVLEIWQELSAEICHTVLMEAAQEVCGVRRA